jgi:hypothetical protein
VSGDPRDLVNSEVREVRARSLDVLSREAAKWREDPSRPSKKDRWQRSRDLATSEVREVKVQSWMLQVANGEATRGSEPSIVEDACQEIQEIS